MRSEELMGGILNSIHNSWYKRITNDGKQDRMLMATALLNQRLLAIEKSRRLNKEIKDPTPTLVDIERTHILFMNAHFKPFAAIGYEYNRVRVQSGTARLGGSVEFSIPQFGDFFHDMVLHVTLGAVTADSINAATSYLAYCEFLGQRLLQNVSFTVNGNPLDQYNEEVMTFHQKFFVTPNKEVGWFRNVGQEVSKQGFVDVAGGRGAGVRQAVALNDGPQTPKVTQPAVDLWLPLLFWFNQDPRLAIPSVSIPYGQRFIDVEFARASQILQHVGATRADDNPTNPPPTPDIETCELYINNIFVNPEIHDIFIKRIGFTLIRVHRQQSVRVNTSTVEMLLNQLKWPIETIYVGLRPSENVNEQLPGMLTKWHVYAQVLDQAVDLCSVGNSFVLDSTGPFANPAHPTAAELENAIRPTVPISGGAGISLPAGSINANTHVHPPNPTVTEINESLAALGLPGFSDAAGAYADPSNPTVAELLAAAPSIHCTAFYGTTVPTLDSLSIQAHGVNLYQDTPFAFYNQYIPYTYGGNNVRTPKTQDVAMITFNLYPGSYQPSGHVNVSRAREFYLNFSSPQVSSQYPADLIIVAIAINFLLILTETIPC